MYVPYDKRCPVSALLGLTLADVSGLESGGDSPMFTTECGKKFQMWHSQDCCESVSINDVEGDVADLIGSPIVVAEQVDSDDVPPPAGAYIDSYTWTFYRLATAKGFVVVRWLGESNGYYSESVDFARIDNLE